MHDHDDDSPHCTSCRRRLRPEETGWYGCGICITATDAQLAELPTLYAQLPDALHPGAGSDASRVSGSRSAPLPLRLEPLSLSARGGIVTILQDWLITWHEHLGWNHPRWQGDLQQQCNQVVRNLRTNLAWAAAEFDAFADFADEVRHQVAACRAVVTGERPGRAVTLACPCGQRLSITLDTPGRRCNGCGTQYGWTELRSLPLAERHTAA